MNILGIILGASIIASIVVMRRNILHNVSDLILDIELGYDL